MPAIEVKKPRNKPPIRRVPPGENRTARNFTMGVAVSAEEMKAMNEIGRLLGFRGGGPLVSWILGNLFQLSKNPLHLTIWELDFYDKLRKAGFIEPDQKMPNLAEDVFPRLIQQFGLEIDKAFGASEKTAPGNTGGQTVGGSHGDST